MFHNPKLHMKWSRAGSDTDFFLSVKMCICINKLGDLHPFSDILKTWTGQSRHGGLLLRWTNPVVLTLNAA